MLTITWAWERATGAGGKRARQVVVSEYRALVAKVEAFTSSAFARRSADMACRRGCDGCCHAWLTVSPVEAAEMEALLSSLEPTRRAAIAERGKLQLAREAAQESPARCAMLEADGSCAVYEARPLVCRTQGHALRYPSGFIPVQAIVAHGSGGDVTHCPLNFQAQPPQPADVLDAERVDQILAVVNHRFASQRGESPERRIGVSALAAGADVLERKSF
jgi:hypothetical protein